MSHRRSRSLHATADIFQQLKANQDEPDPVTGQLNATWCHHHATHCSVLAAQDQSSADAPGPVTGVHETSPLHRWMGCHGTFERTARTWHRHRQGRNLALSQDSAPPLLPALQPPPWECRTRLRLPAARPPLRPWSTSRPSTCCAACLVREGLRCLVFSSHWEDVNLLPAAGQDTGGGAIQRWCAEHGPTSCQSLHIGLQA